jgi:hypothetical protein
MTARQEKHLADPEVLRIAHRHPVDYRWDALNWEFLKLLARIAHYADAKYGRAENYVDSELGGDRSPMNHIPEHVRQYLTGEPHDHFDDPAFHLAAIAYNAMMEFYYLQQRGPRVGELYRPAEWKGDKAA